MEESDAKKINARILRKLEEEIELTENQIELSKAGAAFIRAKMKDDKVLEEAKKKFFKAVFGI